MPSGPGSGSNGSPGGHGPGGHGPSGPGPGRNAPSGHGRTGLIAALACGIILCLVLLLVIVGGLVYLVVQRGAEEQIATVPLELEGITTVIPEGWVAVESSADVGLDVLAARESPDTDERVTISRLVVDLDAADICEMMQGSAKEQGLATESAEILDPVMVDGVSALHYQWIAYAEERWHQGDVYCMDHSSGTVIMLAENSTDAEAAPTPAGALVLEGWRWTE